MNKLFAFFILFAWAASPAMAENKLTTHCQRYESKCTGSACYRLGSALKDDKDRHIYTMRKMDVVQYDIDPTTATATFDNATPNAKLTNGKYTIPYKHAIWRDDVIVLENTATSGVIKEKIEIERKTGFYAYYLMHTDDSIKDVPLGEPYTASFGYCQLPGVVLPVAPEDEEPIAAPTPPPEAMSPEDEQQQ